MVFGAEPEYRAKEEPEREITDADLPRLRALAEEGSLEAVAEAGGVDVVGARSWTKRIGVHAPNPILRRLLAVQALRRMGLYDPDRLR